jgi:hypothetical protein
VGKEFAGIKEFFFWLPSLIFLASSLGSPPSSLFVGLK